MSINVHTIITHTIVCIHKYKSTYTQIKILIYFYVYTIINTHIHVCLHKYKRLRKTLKYL